MIISGVLLVLKGHVALASPYKFFHSTFISLSERPSPLVN